MASPVGLRRVQGIRAARRWYRERTAVSYTEGNPPGRGQSAAAQRFLPLKSGAGMNGGVRGNKMIPEAKGATPFGIFLLANDFLTAAETAKANFRIRSGGPVRLLCFHAIELFLKSYLRAQGQDVDTLRAFGHRLSDIAQSAASCGLDLPLHTQRELSRLTERSDYVRVRYMVIDTKDDIRPKAILTLAGEVREAVREALQLDEFGNPRAPTPS